MQTKKRREKPYNNQKPASCQLLPSSSELQSQSCQSTFSENDGFIQVKSTKRARQLLPECKQRNAKAFVPELIQVVGLMRQMHSTEILSRSCYFGKYGKVVKVILRHLVNHGKFRKSTIAFITYSNKLEAALALVTMQNCSRHENIAVYCNPGTNRFCMYAAQKNFCKNQNCIYLHEMRSDYEICPESKHQRAKELIQIAKRTIVQNLGYFIEKQQKEIQEKAKPNYEASLVKSNCSPWFSKSSEERLIELPSISQTFLALITQGVLDQEKYNRLKAQYRLKQEARQNKVKTLSIKAHVEKSRAALPVIQNNDPYLLKRFLNPRISQGSLSPKSKLNEMIWSRRKERFNQRYLFGKACLMLRKPGQETDPIDALVHKNILKKYEKPNVRKSNINKAAADKVAQTKIRNYLRNLATTN